MNTKVYLGDGVYVRFDKTGDVVLTTENGISITNTIVLEPEVVQSFQLYLSRLKQKMTHESD